MGKNLGIEALVGRSIISAKVNASNDMVVLETTTGPLYLTWVGSCCALCFLAHVSGASALLGVVSSVEDARGIRYTDEDGCVTETMGTTVRTNKGTITFETRVEHNGYYGGEILVCDEGPLNQYYQPRIDKEEDFTPLEDF